LREGLGASPPRARGLLAATLLLFCLPLFVNLGRADFHNDEAIYSFAIDRMLASGDWLVPRALSHDDLPLFDKPPLKFWMVAAPIAMRWLPANEFGHRFWDAAMGAAALVYVFLLGGRLLNPLAGFVSVLMLVAHAPLVFTHGLRSNNMESALVLAYCGGVYHYLRWTASFDVRVTVDERSNVRTTNDAVHGSIHVWAVSLYFVLAFLTKFVAALFLPMILGFTALVVPEHRRALRRGWRTWLLAAVTAIVLSAPWFLFMSQRFGGIFWRELFGVHVFQRLTATLDPGHLQPWSYYLAQMAVFWDTAALMVMASGLIVLAWWTARRADPEAVIFVLWFLVPTVVISLATSKLYHYIYPFLPPLAIAGGYFAALALALGRAPFDRFIERFNARLIERAPRLARWRRRRATRAVLAVAIAGSLALAIGSLVFGRVTFTIGSTELASAGILRPGLAAVLLAVLFDVQRRARPLVLALLVVSFLPLQGYRDSMMLLGAATNPRRTASRCIQDIHVASATAPRGLVIDLPDAALNQSIFYYFEPIRPWHREPTSGGQPVLTTRPSSAGPVLDLGDGVVAVLPGVYGACAAI
jgi:4-amino-4-deoxy-L-arabinose transferase-like glycosyltransferase